MQCFWEQPSQIFSFWIRIIRYIVSSNVSLSWFDFQFNFDQNRRYANTCNVFNKFTILNYISASHNAANTTDLNEFDSFHAKFASSPSIEWNVVGDSWEPFTGVWWQEINEVLRNTDDSSALYTPSLHRGWQHFLCCQPQCRTFTILGRKLLLCRIWDSPLWQFEKANCVLFWLHH